MARHKGKPLAVASEELQTNGTPIAGNDCDLPADVINWDCIAAGRDQNYRARLYRIYTQEGSKRESRDICKTYVSRLPEPDEIGAEFGGGDFQLMVIGEDPSTNARTWWKSFCFRIDRRWDEIKAARAAAAPAAPVPPVDPSAQIASVVAAITPILQVFTGMMKSNQGSDTTQAMAKMVEMQGDILSQNFKRQLDLAHDTGRLIREEISKVMDDNQAAGDAGDNMAIIREVLGMAKEYLPMLMIAPPATLQNMGSKVMESRPDIRAILSDKAQLAGLVARLKKELGIDATNKLLTMFGISPAATGGNMQKVKQPKSASTSARQ
ncbi:hypothetical protein EH223_08450 [candidate division KSB1 bacterium]|nr:MAG: hypothetical protein EH223_08450 [candidate division KSB1 bacterium]